jgi:hypothetical protein
LARPFQEGEAREAWEEARADIVLDGILGVFSISRIGQVQVIFRARFASPGFSPGPESLEVALFAWQCIPRDEIAFPSVNWALDAWRQASAAPLGAPADDPRGTRPLVRKPEDGMA